MSTFHIGRKSDGVTALLAVTLDRAAGEPLSRQLYRRIREAILSGQVAADARLPSTRRLCEDLGVSRTVPLAAYDQLIMEGYVEPRRGSGQFVRRLRDVDRSAASETPIDHPAPPAAPKIAPRARPFHPACQPTSAFPHGAWARLLARGWRVEGPLAGTPQDWSGNRSLRGAIARHLNALRGIDCDADQVLVTSGNADALQLIVRALAPSAAERHAGAWVEDPGYIESRAVLADAGLTLTPVPVDEQGLDVDAGRELSPKARFALVTPSRQFPLGMPMSLPRRLALVAWALENSAVLIEDDYDTEIRFSGRPIASLLSLDRGAAALSLGSLSKLTFPGLRLGYIVGSRSLIDRLTAARATTGSIVATSAQPALAAFILDGGFARRLRDLRRELTASRDRLIAALNGRLGEQLTVLPQEVGMYLTVVLNDQRQSDAAIAARASDFGLSLDPLSGHASGPSPRQGFLLGFAGCEAQEIAGLVERFAELLTASPWPAASARG